MKAIQRLYRNERGMSMLFVSLGMIGFLAASTLAIDVGMLMTARTQAQTSADSGALAGATALVYNSFTDHSNNGPAVTSAVNTALSNQVVAQPVSVRPSDVEFLNDPVTDQTNLVKVTVYRTVARDNPVPTLMGRLIGINQADVQATATAQAGWANAQDCVLPFTIPDKWIEKQCNPGPEICDPGTTYDPSDTFDMYDSKGILLPNPDIYVPPDSVTPPPTGFNPVRDRGMEITLKDGTGQNSASASWYNPWDINGVTGANYYSNSISGCNNTVLNVNDMMVPETGNMVGPTKQGVAALVAQDPNAYWDGSCQCVKGSAFNLSPRIRPVPLYNPVVFAQGKATGKSGPQLEVVGFLGFFIESLNGGGDVTGRITPVLGKIILGGPQVTSGFSQVVMLVK
jgi:Flp pilus assembly protein TadG